MNENKSDRLRKGEKDRACQVTSEVGILNL